MSLISIISRSTRDPPKCLGRLARRSRAIGIGSLLSDKSTRVIYTRARRDLKSLEHRTVSGVGDGLCFAGNAAGGFTDGAVFSRIFTRASFISELLMTVTVTQHNVRRWNSIVTIVCIEKADFLRRRGVVRCGFFKKLRSILGIRILTLAWSYNIFIFICWQHMVIHCCISIWRWCQWCVIDSLSVLWNAMFRQSKWVDYIFIYITVPLIDGCAFFLVTH